MLRLIKKQYRNLLLQKKRKGQQRRCLSKKNQRKNQNRNRRNLPKLSVNHDTQAGHSIFAHSRPDKIGTPRFLPLYIRNILNGISAKKIRSSTISSHDFKNVIEKMAEGEGFEPPVELPPQRFSRPPHSTTLAPLRKCV